MPSTTAYLDSYNTSIDRINTCIMSAVFSPDNTRLIASDDQGRLGLFYSSPQISSKPIFLTTLSNTHQSQNNSISNNNNNSISLASSANGMLIVVGGSNHNGLVQGYRWSDIISNKRTTPLPSDAFSFDLARGPNEIFVCVEAPTKKQQQKTDEIIVGSSTGTLRVLNIERQTLVTTVDAAHKGTIHQVAFANDGKRVASSFDLARGPNEIFVCVEAPTKKQQQKTDEIIVGSSTGTLRVLNIERQTLVTTVDAAHKGTIHQVAFANDGKRVASCSEDGTCKIWDLSSSSHQPIHTIETKKWISCCAFDMATDRLVIGGECPLSLWHLAMLSSSTKQKPLLVYNSIPTPIYSLALCSADDDTILVGGETNKLYSIPKNGDEQAMTISRPTTPSPIYTIATTINNTSMKENEDIKIAVGGSHYHIDSFTITEANIRKIGHYEFSK
ncbi:unnamed protein product [Adineta steineri]|uniref:Uncharacterized protein n=1 Tax=Adineta steineri TaxID=433720 RepID=A0A813TPS2_9BILA|nr:unnamed protein product [Adineta steineri]